MINWLLANLATVVLSLVLLLIVFLVVRGMIRDKRSGKSSCGCGCEGCSGCSTCSPGSSCSR